MQYFALSEACGSLISAARQYPEWYAEVFAHREELF
jgi:hypothetical protein